MTPIRKGSNPVKIPFPIKTTDKTLAAWCNEVRNSLIQLEGRIPTMRGGMTGGGKRLDPFSIVVSGTDLKVQYGNVKAGFIATDNDTSPGNDIISFREVGITINTGELIADPLGTGVPGALTVSTSTTYGVWLELDFEDPGTNYRNPWSGRGMQFINWLPMQFSTSGRVIISSTYTLGSQVTTLTAASVKKGYAYVGKVVVNGSGVATITQHLRSDIILPVFGLPHQILSDDADQSLIEGTDGGIYYDEP
jgi:hypothetical protein